MAKVIRIPIDINSPEQTGVPGNAFWTVLSATAAQLATWAFYGASGGVTGGIIYGRVEVPSIIDANTTPRIVMNIFGNSGVTAGSLSAWKVGTLFVQTGESMDRVFNMINAANWTAPTTALAKNPLSFTTTAATTADTTILVKFERDNDGTSATDNCTSTVYLFDAFLEFTATG